MANSRMPGPLGLLPRTDWHAPLLPQPGRPGACGPGWVGDTPGTLGFMDWSDPVWSARQRGASAGAGITIAQLRKIFPGAKADKLTMVADELNTNPVKFGVGTALQKAHFFAQVREEGGARLMVKVENLQYRPEALLKFDYYKKHRDEAITDGYEKDAKTKNIVRDANFEAIANKAYGNRKELGNVNEGDGWRYRGRGLLQLTGRANYAACTTKCREIFPGSQEDFEAQPELLEDFRFAVRSAVCFWLMKRLDVLADGSGDAKVNRITAVINKNTDSYEKRRNHFRVAYDAFS